VERRPSSSQHTIHLAALAVQLRRDPSADDLILIPPRHPAGPLSTTSARRDLVIDERRTSAGPGS